VTSQEMLEEIASEQKKDDMYITRAIRGLGLSYPCPDIPTCTLAPNVYNIKYYLLGVHNGVVSKCPIKPLKEKYPDLFSLEEKDWYKKPDLVFYKKIKEAYKKEKIQHDIDELNHKRKVRYKRIDPLLFEGLAEKEEGRPEKLNEYFKLREQVKKDIPKN
jgi:hypothetical protein